MMPRARFAFFLFIALFAFTGCAHYQLGTASKLTFTTLYIAPVENKTRLPQAQAILTAQLRDAFARDARVTLVNSPDAADATLILVVTDYHRDVATVREGDTALARKFILTLSANATLRDRTSKPLFADRPLTVRRDAFTDSGAQTYDNQLQSEYQALPLLATALAAQATHAVLDVW